jgi:hypothetical protein
VRAARGWVGCQFPARWNHHLLDELICESFGNPMIWVKCVKTRTSVAQGPPDIILRNRGGDWGRGDFRDSDSQCLGARLLAGKGRFQVAERSNCARTTRQIGNGLMPVFFLRIAYFSFRPKDPESGITPFGVSFLFFPPRSSYAECRIKRASTDIGLYHPCLFLPSPSFGILWLPAARSFRSPNKNPSPTL